MKKLITKRNGIIAAVLAVVTGVVMLAVPGKVQVVNASGVVLSTHNTISACLNAVQSGQTCAVGEGTYNEQVKITKSNVSLIADGIVNTKQIFVTGSNNVVRGFVVKDPSVDAGLRVTGNFNLFEDNEVSNTKQDGVWFWGHDNTFRGNYIHDILDPSAAGTNGGDPHVDCFQTWDWDEVAPDTYNILFEGNTCNHTRTSGSNQIVMLSGTSHELTFRNNRFIMHDAGYSPVALYGGRNFTIENNYFCNTTNNGQAAVYLSGASGVTLKGNQYGGYSSFVSGSGVLAQSGTVKFTSACQIFAQPQEATGTPTATKTVISPSATPQTPATSTKLPSATPVAPTLTRMATPVSQPNGNIYVAPAGAGTTCTVTTPCSLSSGIQKAVAGDGIILADGNYPTIAIAKQGTQAKPITLTGTGLINSLKIDGSNWIIIDGLRFAGNDAITIINSHYVTVQNSDLNYIHAGVMTTGSSHLLIKSNVIYQKFPTGSTWTDLKDSKWEGGGFYASSNGQGVYHIVGNTFRDAFNGVYLTDDQAGKWMNSNVFIHHNRFERIVDDPFEPEGDSFNVHFFNNTVIDSHRIASFAPQSAQTGPVFIYGNFGNMCSNLTGEPSRINSAWKVGLGSNLFPNRVYVFNNSYVADCEGTNSYAYDLLDSTITNAQFQNNVYIPLRASFTGNPSLSNTIMAGEISSKPITNGTQGNLVFDSGGRLTAGSMGRNASVEVLINTYFSSPVVVQTGVDAGVLDSFPAPMFVDPPAAYPSSFPANVSDWPDDSIIVTPIPNTLTPTATRTATRTPTVTPTKTASRTPTWTYTSTMTMTPTKTLTRTPTQTPSPTPTITKSSTPTATQTFTATATNTPTTVPTNEYPIMVIVSDRGAGKVLNIRETESIWADVPGAFYAGAELYVLEIFKVEEEIQGVTWINYYGRIAQNVNIPLLYRGDYYTSWRQ